MNQVETPAPGWDAPPAAKEVAARFAALPQVRAIAWAGSVTAGWGDERSDLDFDIYVTEEIPLPARAAIAADLGERVELDNRFWEPGDEWIHCASGRHVDIIYRSPEWIEEQIGRVLDRHEASVGYSTCFWHNVLTARPLFDRGGWFAALQERARVPYPGELRSAVVAKNWPILRQNLSSYAHQLELAFVRHDRISINHRLAALLASYWDVLFAVNRQPHPGEKRLVQFATRTCGLLPDGMAQDLDALLAAGAAMDWDHGRFAACLNQLLDRLDALLLREGLLPPV